MKIGKSYKVDLFFSEEWVFKHSPALHWLVPGTYHVWLRYDSARDPTSSAPNFASICKGWGKAVGEKSARVTRHCPGEILTRSWEMARKTGCEALDICKMTLRESKRKEITKTRKGRRAGRGKWAKWSVSSLQKFYKMSWGVPGNQHATWRTH